MFHAFDQSNKGINFFKLTLLSYRKGAIMFTITVVVFSLLIGALAHKLYLESKMAKKRKTRFEPLLAKGVSQKGVDT